MYGAMREHAPQSTRLAGVITATAVTLAAGYVLATGMGGHIARLIPDPIVFVSIPETPRETLPSPDTRFDDNSEITLPTATPTVVIDAFEIENPPITGQADVGPRPPITPDAPAAPAPSKPSIRTSAKMLPADLPPYPASERRKGNEGVSVLNVCLDARGRVTSASLASTSGHPALDQAALKWVRDLKFTPAKVDGVPQPVCGHDVTYEWTLDRR